MIFSVHIVLEFIHSYVCPNVSARSGGHGEIETVDHFKYSFNGHGEYIFLRYNDSDKYSYVLLNMIN